MTEKAPEDFIRVSQELEATKEAHKVLQGKYADLEAQLKPLQGVNLQELIDNNKKYQESIEKGGKGAKDQTEFDALWSEREQALRAENQRALDELKGKFESTVSEVQSWQSKYNELVLVDAALTQIAPDFLASEDVLEFLKDKIRKELGRDDEGFFIKDKEGKPIKKDGGNVRLGLEDYKKSLIEKLPSLVKDKSLSGTRTPSEGAKKTTGEGVIEKTKVPPADFHSWHPAKMKEWYEQNPDAVPPKFM